MPSPQLEEILKGLSAELAAIKDRQAQAEIVQEAQRVDRHKLNNQLGATILDVGRRQLATHLEISSLTENVDVIKRSMQRIETALLGDEAMGNAGIVRRMDKVETMAEEVCDRVSKLETERSSVRSNVTFYLAVIGSVVSVLMVILKAFGQ